ncbi:hypothetical protein [Spiroplasma endosymbiont of Aspidapion aeneum]|uniref:hypothetical protein n=1 Tax=Spiroplasma endosymbiont of Aspidapion aeneum TaxID=3066276 RepID=UPI00313E4406
MLKKIQIFLKQYLDQKKQNYFSSNHNKYVRDDRVKNTYKTPIVIGINGTYFRFYLKGKKNITKTCAIISYGWAKKNIISCSFQPTENFANVLKVIKKINNYAKNENKKIIIQIDRGTAFANKSIYDYVDSSKNIFHSMSNSGFKHNSPTESLNGWIKQKFFKSFGRIFRDMKHFYNCFQKFVKNWNWIKEINYNLERK